MYRFVLSAIFIIAITGCSGGNPSSPDIRPDLSGQKNTDQSTYTNLWGLYEISIDTETMTVETVSSRSGMFTANVTNLLNANPANLGFNIKGIVPGPDYIDVDIDISITHPLPGAPQYSGYDVRGVFMGDGSSTLSYNPDLNYAVDGVDQMMIPDPTSGTGGPDGYTRWYNYSEFSEGGLPLFNYTPGAAASPGFVGTAVVNPYRTFASGLSAEEDLWDFLNSDPGNCDFFSGETNTRNYYLRFPITKGVKYGYAVIASWKGIDPTDHPAHAPEAIACSVIDSSTAFWSGPTTYGGELMFDISLWDWDSTLTSTAMEDYRIYIESGILDSVYQFTDSDMIPVGGDENYSTYHVELEADQIESDTGQEYWIIVEQNGYDYTNEFGVPNLADTDPLTSFFRYDLDIKSGPGNIVPIINGITDDVDPNGLNTTVDDTYTSVTYSAIYNDPDVGQTHTILWYIEDNGTGGPEGVPDDMPYDWSLKPDGEYEIWVTVDDGFDMATGGPFNVIKSLVGWAKTWGAENQDRGYGIAIDSEGNIYVSGNFYSTVDFDPGPDVENHSSNGARNSFLTKFAPDGTHLWAQTWGGNVSFGGGAHAVTVDVNDNPVTSGYFYGTVDFDPGPGVENHSSNSDTGDAFISKFDADGNHLWAATWGSDDEFDDSSLGVSSDSSGSIYAGGGFRGTADFDPGAGVEMISSNGYRDCFLLKVDSDGNYQWAKTFGGTLDDYGFGVKVDGNDSVYFTGWYSNLCDFDPGPDLEEYDSTVDGKTFLTKFDSNGDHQWARAFAGPFSYGYSLDVDSSDNIYVCGGWGGTAQFDTDGGTEELTTANVRNGYLNVFASDSKWQYVLTWDSIIPPDTSSGFIGYEVAIDSSDQIYLTGHFTGTANLDPTGGTDERTTNGLRDIYVMKLSSPSTLEWIRTFGAESTDDGSGIVVNSDGDSYTTGWFYGTVDFYPGAGVDEHTTHGSLDAYLLKLNSDGNW
ncbi:MAG TPA: SBBP repeat-containing protein [bacterium]|jgi:hypothetical protein